MQLVPNLIPITASTFFTQGRKLFNNVKGTFPAFEGSRDLIEHTIRVSLAAGICFAAYKGSLVAAGLLATFSLPATTIAAGAFLLKFGYTALKVGYLAQQVKMLGLGAAALYAGWQALDNPTFSSRGFLEGNPDIRKERPIYNLSHAIAEKLGYK